MMPPYVQAAAAQASSRKKPPTKRKKSAPLPAPAAVPAPMGKAMSSSIGQMLGLNRLRGMRLKTTGL